MSLEVVLQSLLKICFCHKPPDNMVQFIMIVILSSRESRNNILETLCGRTQVCEAMVKPQKIIVVI